MKIPEFDSTGKLPEGIHICSGQEFVSRFATSGKRKQYVKPISDIFDFAKDRHAVQIFIGGSFISSIEEPNDIDCVIVFKCDRDIPSHTERVAIAGLRFDILYASLESRNIVDSYIKLFSSGRMGNNSIGVVQIDLYDKHEIWKILHQPDDESFEIIKRVYNDRSLIDINEKVGILVTIHGLFSRSEWNMDISPIASSQGWIVAPYIYDTNKPDLLFDTKKRAKVVDDFREWIYDINQRYDHEVSIVAHSFGTYIVGAYLTGFDENECPPVTFNSVILTGSILSVDFDWEKYRGLSVGSIYNMIAPNDEYVKYMPESDLKKYIGMSSLFGRSGVEGFVSDTPMLSQSKNTIFTHTNTIKRDIIETKWMPFLNANTHAMYTEMADYLRRQRTQVENKGKFPVIQFEK
jgi:hypothetical protein